MKSRVAVVVAALLVATSAYADDAIQAGVTILPNEPAPTKAENGTGYTPGTYATGTIILDYTHVGTQFPAGRFTTFGLDLKVYRPTSPNPTKPNNDPKPDPNPTYPVALTLEDIGSKHLTLWTSSSPVAVEGLNWTARVPVEVSIPDEVAANLEFQKDGAQIVGHLKMTTPGGSKLDTVTDVIVKIHLVHPTANGCVKVYNFVSDAQLTDTIQTTEIVVNPRHKVTSTNPYGSLSSNVLVVNTCATPVRFDLNVVLDPAFSTQPSNNPGNAVFTFSTSEEMDQTTFDIAAFGTGTKQGQNLCLQNVTVPPASSFLAAVHMSINNGMLDSELRPFNFSATLSVAGSSSCPGPGAPLPEAVPNTASAPLAFTIK